MNWPRAAKYLILRPCNSESLDKTQTKWFKSITPHFQSPAEPLFGYTIRCLIVRLSQPPLATWENCSSTGPWRNGMKKNPLLQRPHGKGRPGCRAGHHPSVPPRHARMPRHWEKLHCHLTLVGETWWRQKSCQRLCGKRSFPLLELWNAIKHVQEHTFEGAGFSCKAWRGKQPRTNLGTVNVITS